MGYPEGCKQRTLSLSKSGRQHLIKAGWNIVLQIRKNRLCDNALKRGYNQNVRNNSHYQCWMNCD